MGRKKRALLISTGTTHDGKQKSIDSMAKGLLTSAYNQNPDIIYFIVSDSSEATIESMKRQYSLEKDDEFYPYKSIKINDIDDFDEIFNIYESKIIELEEDGYEITIEFTTGTKQMSLAAAFAAMLYKKTLIKYRRKRDGTKYVEGTETIETQNFYRIYDKTKIGTIKESFNNNRYETGKSLIKELSGTINKELYYDLFTSYQYFDNTEYEQAYKNFKIDEFKEEWPEFSNQLNKNKQALHELNSEFSSKKTGLYQLGCMLNNAKRRAGEYKYDDAIARLYRSLELMAQLRLKEKELNSSNIDIEILKTKKLSQEDIDYYEKLRDQESKKIRIGLIEDFELLNKIGNPLGKEYKKIENEVKNVIKFRNESILAHGLKPLSKEQYQQFEEVVLKLANVFDKKIDSYIEFTQFPKFKD